MRIYSCIFHSLGEGRAVYMSKRKHDDILLLPPAKVILSSAGVLR